MRAAIVIAILAFAALAAAQQDGDFESYLFRRYVETHGKTYAAEEVDMRFQIFKQNLALVRDHNEKFARGEVTFKVGMNHLADMTNAEYRQRMLSYRNLEFPSTIKSTRFDHTQVPLDDSVDWRTKGVVTPIKDQGQCGSCWAFSAVGSMEGAHALTTGTLLAFSEQELVDCVNGGAQDCNTGGWMDDGFTYAIQHGMEVEADYPYTARSDRRCKFNSAKVQAHFSNYKDVQSGSETALQAAVTSQPTVSVAIDASSWAFQLYSGGVYNDNSCSPQNLDHGVLAVGYGALNGTPYWIVKNSWGTSWGMQGYILMSRNKNNQCGIATAASFITV